MFNRRFVFKTVCALFFFFTLVSFANDTEMNSKREMPPWIVFERDEKVGSPVDYNGIIDPGESIGLPFRIRNAGIDTAYSLRNSSRVAETNVTITNPIKETSFSREMSWIVFEYCEIIDSTGDDDGIIDPGEIIELPIAVRNVGADAAYSLMGTLRTTDPYVTITDSVEEFGDVPPGSVSRCFDAFRFDVSADCPSNHIIDFVLVTIDDDERISTNAFSIFVLSGDIFISVDTLDFETAFIGYSDTMEFQLINIGNGILEVNDITSDNFDYSVDITSFILLPGEDRTVRVMFSPASEGASAGSLTVQSDLSDTTIIFLRGEGLEPPDISVSPASFSDSLFVGETSNYSLTLYNIGGSELDFHLSLEGGNSMHALKSDGYDDYVEVPDHSSLSAIGEAFTLEFWMMLEEYPLQNREILGKWGSGDDSDDEYSVNVLNSGELELAISGRTGGLSSIYSKPISPYIWTHVAGVFNSENTSLKLFINGILESDITPRTRSMDRDTYEPFCMGTYDLYFYSDFKGQLDEVRIWNVARTQAEIRTNIYQELRGTEPGLVGYWKFNEGPGNISYDSSPNNNDGTFHGEVTRVVSRSPVMWLYVDTISGTVPAGNSVNIEVTLDARGLIGGDYDTHIVISSNDPDEPEIIIPAHLHVTGIPDISVSKDTLNCGTVFTGYSSIDTLTVSNKGTDSLTISNIFADNSDFVVDITNFSLAPEENQEVVVTFTPSTTGAITGILTITSNDPDESPFAVYLEGECIEPPDISISTDSLIDSLLIDETSTQWLKIRNTGLSMLTFNAFIKEVSGSFLEEVFGTWRGNVLKDRMNSRGNIYSVNSTTILREIKFYMDVGTSTRMYFVVYEADEMQTYFDKIGETYIDSSGTGRRWYSSGPMYVELVAGKYYYIGTCWEGFAKYGYSSWIDPEPPLPTSFGRLERGISTSAALEFPPSETIYISSSFFRAYYQTIITGKGILRASPYKDTIPAEDSLETELTFDATELNGGDYFADITIMSNDPEEQEIMIPARLHVTGVPDIAISEDSFDLGNIFVGLSITDTLIITNEGTDSLMISNISSDNTDFTVDINNFSLCSGSNQEILLIFTPGTTGIRTATLTIESNDPDEPIKTVFLQGEGLSAPVMTVRPEYLSDTLTTGESANHILTIGNAGGNNLSFKIVYESTEGAGPILALNNNQITLGVKNKTETTDLLNQFVENQSTEKEFQSEKPEGDFLPATRASYIGDYLRFNISDYGEIIPFQYPVGTEHLQIGDYLSGYTICYNDGGDKVEWAGFMDRSGIVAVSYNEVINNADSAVMDVITQTSGGELTLKQRFTFDKHDQFIRNKVSIENTGGTTLNNIVFKKWADWDVDGDYRDDNWNYDITHTAIYAWDENYCAIAGQTQPDYRDIEGWDDYNRRITDEDYIDGPIMGFDGLEVLHYELGNLSSGEERLLTFAYGAADNLIELKSVIERGITGAERFTANPDTGTVPTGDSVEIEVTFDAASLYSGDYYANLLISSNDPITPLDTVFCFLHVIGVPVISTSSDTLEFSADSTDTLELRVRNDGTDDLQVTNISSDNSDYSVDINNFSLLPNGSQTIRVVFTPTSGGQASGILTIQSNDPGKTNYTIALIGNDISGIENNIPKAFFVSANYPNPFCRGTVIKYGCPKRAKVSIQVFDIMGRLVNTLVDKEMEAGYHEVRWDGSTNSGRKVASSVYFYRMQAGGFEKTRKMIFAK